MKRILITAMAILAACSITGCSAVDNSTTAPAENGAPERGAVEQAALAANASPEVINIEKEEQTLPVIKTKLKEWDEDKLKAMFVDTRDNLVLTEYPSDIPDDYTYKVYKNDWEDDIDDDFWLVYENGRIRMDDYSDSEKYGYRFLASAIYPYSLGEYFNDEEIALFPKEDAVNRANALLDELGIKNYSEPEVFALTADKANAELDRDNYDTYEKWTADDEVYVLRYSLEYNGIKLTEIHQDDIGGRFVGSKVILIVTKDDIISINADYIFSDEYEETGETVTVKCTKEQALEIADKYFKATLRRYEDPESDVKVQNCEIVYIPLDDYDFDTGYISLAPMWRVDITYADYMPMRDNDCVFVNVYTGAPLTAGRVIY